MLTAPGAERFQFGSRVLDVIKAEATIQVTHALGVPLPTPIRALKDMRARRTVILSVSRTV